MTLTLHSPLDMHLHLRQGDMLAKIARYSSDNFSGAIIMPNTIPPITTKEQVVAYKKEILQNTKDFTPYMTLFFKTSYDKAFLQSIKDEIIAIKLYPAGITTNSDDGVSGFNIDQLASTLEAMSDLGIPLCVHGETDGFVLDREAEFMSIYETLAQNFPKLTIIMEHITTKEACEMVQKYDNLFATITMHHLYITLDDVVGGMLNPHLFCKPIAKKTADKEALLFLALNAHPKVMFGSDSAPHPRDKKESSRCAAGVFSAPIALQALAQLFESNNKLQNLQAFVSDNAQKIYGIRPLEKKIRLKRKPFVVPNEYNGVVPIFAGETLKWSIA